MVVTAAWLILCSVESFIIDVLEVSDGIHARCWLNGGQPQKFGVVASSLRGAGHRRVDISTKTNPEKFRPVSSSLGRSRRGGVAKDGKFIEQVVFERPVKTFGGFEAAAVVSEIATPTDRRIVPKQNIIRRRVGG